MEPAAVGQQIKKIYPQYANVDDATLGQKYLNKYGAQVQGITSGQLQTTDLPIEQRAAVSVGLNAAGYKPESQSATEKVSQQKFTDVSNNLDLLLKNYANIQGKGPVAGTGEELLAKITKGGMFSDVAAYEALRKSMIGPLARTISGEVGVLTDKDISRAEGLLPKISDDPKLASEKVDNLRKLIANKVSKNSTNTSNVESTSTQAGGVTSNGENVAQLYSGDQALYRQQYGPLAPLMEKLAGLQTGLGNSDVLPAAGGVLGFGIAGPAGSGIGATMGAVGKQQLKGGAHLPTQEEANQVIKTGATDFATSLLLSGAGKVAGKVLHPFNTLGEYRAAKMAEASGQTISGDTIIKSVENAGRNVSPTSETAYKKFVQLLKDRYTGQTLSVDNAVKLNQEANKAFTAAGKVGKSGAAAFNKAMGDAIKSELKLNAPDVAKANHLFSLLYKGQKVVGDTTKRVLPYAILGKMLQMGGL